MFSGHVIGLRKRQAVDGQAVRLAGGAPQVREQGEGGMHRRAVEGGYPVSLSAVKIICYWYEELGCGRVPLTSGRGGTALSRALGEAAAFARLGGQGGAEA